MQLRLRAGPLKPAVAAAETLPKPCQNLSMPGLCLFPTAARPVGRLLH